MKSITISAATALAAMPIATPCRAADIMPTNYYREGKPAAFAGAIVRLELDGRRRAKPTARLQLGMIGRSQEAALSSTGTRNARAGLELGLTSVGRPDLYVGGQPVGQMRERLNLQGSTGTTVAIIFGVALLAVGVLVITNLDGLGDSGSKPAGVP